MGMAASKFSISMHSDNPNSPDIHSTEAQPEAESDFASQLASLTLAHSKWLANFRLVSAF